MWCEYVQLLLYARPPDVSKSGFSVLMHIMILLVGDSHNSFKFTWTAAPSTEDLIHAFFIRTSSDSSKGSFLFLYHGLIYLSSSRKHTHTLTLAFFLPRVYGFASVSFWMAFAFSPLFKCSWPFTLDLSPHSLVIFLTLSFTEDAHSYLYQIYYTCILLGEYH